LTKLGLALDSGNKYVNPSTANNRPYLTRALKPKYRRISRPTDLEAITRIYDTKTANPDEVYNSTTLFVGIAKGACSLNPS
jgi:hypothetical protein